MRLAQALGKESKRVIGRVKARLCAECPYKKLCKECRDHNQEAPCEMTGDQISAWEEVFAMGDSGGKVAS